MFKNKNLWLWLIWLLLTLALTTYLVMKINNKAADKSIFLPGDTTHGHHQIELACGACHSESFADEEAIQESCMNCHGKALKDNDDKHPKSKFTDPRNAERVAILDARYCVTCHIEHNPEVTLEMGLTMPPDYCHLCHEKIAEERPSHEGMAFTTCASAGCHNYHDNQALYEDYLIKHLHQPDILEKQELPPDLNMDELAPVLPDYPSKNYPLERLKLVEADVPQEIEYDSEILYEWFDTTHANSGVNCTACHQETVDDKTAWTDTPDHKVCASCHGPEVDGFLAGKHGMRLDKERLKQELSAMTPALARLPMKKDAQHEGLGCNSCHEAHGYSTNEAKVQACLGCHDDEHSLAYLESPHHELWQQEQAGELPEHSGVTCATCHMPRIEKEFMDGMFYMGIVQHNQNDTLKPNEKMLRPVCMDCHGLGFSIDALADDNLIKNNFDGQPAIHIESMDMVEIRMKEAEEKKKRLREQAQNENL